MVALLKRWYARLARLMSADKVDGLSSFTNRLLSSGLGSGERVKSQAMTPVLVMAGIFAPLGAACVLCGKHWAVVAFGAVLVCLLLLFAGASYVYWAIADPDRLGSDRYLIESRVLALAEQKGDGGARLVQAPNYVAVEEPDRRDSLDG